MFGLIIAFLSGVVLGMIFKTKILTAITNLKNKLLAKLQ